MIEKLKEKIISFMINEQTKTSFKVNRNWGWFYYTDVIVNALILQSFIEANIDFPEAHKVIKWLLDKRKNDSWISTHENAIVFRAFDSYLKKYENIQPNFEYDILLNQRKIINGLFKSRFDNIQEKTIYIKDYKFDDFKFSFNKIGDGILYYLIRYKYILKNYPNKKNAGFNIEKKIYDLEKGNEITNNNFIRGKKYKIVFDIYTPVERYFVVLNDPLPSGFEPIIFEDQIEKDFYYYRSFEHSEKYKDKVIFTSRILPKGSHKVEYIVFCSLPGKFSTPPTYVEEMYNPENYGYFSIGNYIIRNE